LHIAKKVLTGFLDIYNPTVITLRQHWAWFPMPAFEYREWLIGLIAACVILTCLAPLAFRGARWLRPLARIFAAIMLLNDLGRTLFTILGRTVESVTFPRPAPGFYSSPLLLAASLWMMLRLRPTAER
jgi:multisubunit Na+/H+ antiporter MnhE subunit